MNTLELENINNNLNTTSGSHIGVCRTCLSIATEKNMSDLPDGLCEDTKSYLDIMMFCLNLQITPDSKITTKLCFKCYSNIISYYRFKSLALKSDKYLRSLDQNIDSKNGVFVTKDIKSEEPYNISNEQQSNMDMELDFEVKEENDTEELQSDDELLSVIQRIKYENVKDEESKENDNKPMKSKKLKKLKKKQETTHQVCEECGRTVRNLKEHMYLHQPLLTRKRYKCKVCEKMFSSCSARYKHYKTKHLGIKQHCNECNKDVVSLSAHRMVIHNTESLPYECVSCGRRFISRSLRDHHMLTHTKNRPHPCDQCEKTFKSNYTLMQHRRQVHDKEKSHLCQFCSKRFFKKYHLQVHLRSHSKEKPYECPDCGKFFSSTSVLKNHRLIHSEVKMFACQVCDMTFSKPGYLKNHMISHTKEKKYACKYCGVRFGRSDHCLRHQRTAHEKLITNTA
ncbi:zinc finger protein 436-like [Danaus plexippus]|uniref:zinc finger protein 436-like n=1 Tax=Danaus plexippus TaxID=13037 RepID=UPI002AB239FB|nr:zinc finger protein 436-like [Danaus plexippus]